MTACPLTASSKMHLMHTGRAGIRRQYCSLHRGQSLSRSFRASSAINHSLRQSRFSRGGALTHLDTKTSMTSRGYFGINNMNASFPSTKRTDENDIPPLDLLSVLENIPDEKAKDPDQAFPFENIAKQATGASSSEVDSIDIPPFDLVGKESELAAPDAPAGDYGLIEIPTLDPFSFMEDDEEDEEEEKEKGPSSDSLQGASNYLTGDSISGANNNISPEVKLCSELQLELDSDSMQGIPYFQIGDNNTGAKENISPESEASRKTRIYKREISNIEKKLASGNLDKGQELVLKGNLYRLQGYLVNSNQSRQQGDVENPSQDQSNTINAYVQIGDNSTGAKEDISSESEASRKTRIYKREIANIEKKLASGNLDKGQELVLKGHLYRLQGSLVKSNQSRQQEDEENPSQDQSNTINAYEYEISQIKRKLRSRNLEKGLAPKLRMRLLILKEKMNQLKYNTIQADDNEAAGGDMGGTNFSGWDPSNATSQHDVDAKMNGYADEIFYIKRKLSMPNLEKGLASRLRRELVIKQQKLNELKETGHVQPPSQSRSRVEKPRRREARSFVLPKPKASSRGVLLPDFHTDVIQTQANGTVLGSSGTTSILSTVILVPPDTASSSVNDKNKTFQQTVLDSIQQRNAQNGSLFLPLQVEYRERWHASGKIPTNWRRRDNSGPLSEREVLASRAIDRTLRPWLMKGLGESTTGEEGLNIGSLPENIVVNCQVQSYDTRSSTITQQRTHADPTALAINSAIAAIYQSAYTGNASLPVPMEAAACIKLAMRRDGSVIYDPTPAEAEECAFELLYAGTKDKVLMFEFSAKGDKASSLDDGSFDNNYYVDPGIPEDIVADALRLAGEAILPIIQHQEDLRAKYSEGLAENDGLMSDEEVARMLGFDSTADIVSQDLEVSTIGLDEFSKQSAERFLDEAYEFVWSRLKTAALKSFGFDEQDINESSSSSAFIYKGELLSKKIRGRRETLVQDQVMRLLRDDFHPQNLELDKAYRGAISDDSSFLETLKNHIHERLMQQGFGMAASKGFRSDSRPLNAVRPISAKAPMFPDCVHGSSLFSRGETQVLCTATISAPRDGQPIVNPYSKASWDDADIDLSKVDDDKIPIGSLRFLRSQVKLESDMNSRRVKAGREMTGDSGILSEVKRSFLHYDFPDFSTGNIKSRASGAANRRAIGHGNLAERAILPVLPHPDEFPYSVRLTCEVTSSNGSSSMASACGATLSMLDAGVPISSAVAGVSVGLASESDHLLLDITGTEDHFGNMDCKVCGTSGGITAIQCDVKNPVKLDLVINALDLAKQGRNAILSEMEEACMETLGGLVARNTMKSTVPRVEVIKFDPNRKRYLMGPGGSVLRQLEDRFNVTLDLSQEGRCLIFGAVDTVSEAKNVILDLVGDVEVGGIYEGTVVDIKDFGAVIELLRNKEGLLHVSELTDLKEKHPGGNLGLVNEHVKVGDKIQVLCTNIDHVQGTIKLSRKKLLKKQKYLSDTHQQGELDESYNTSESDSESCSINSVGEGNELDEDDGNQFDINNIDGEEVTMDDDIKWKDGDISTTGGEGEFDEDDDFLDEKNESEEADLIGSGDTFDDSTDYDLEEQVSDSDLSLLTVPQLKEKCREANLPVGGRKAELIERLSNIPDS